MKRKASKDFFYVGFKSNHEIQDITATHLSKERAEDFKEWYRAKINPLIDKKLTELHKKRILKGGLVNEVKRHTKRNHKPSNRGKN